MEQSKAESQPERILVAMSGGVDSSVCAALLHEEDYDIVGVFMRNGVKHDVEHAGKPNKQGCCSVEDSMDAGRVASSLGIPFYALNFEEDFHQIIDYFVDEYRKGRTPNPCVVCNNDLKFGKLLDYAKDVNAGRVATGHYAQVRFERERWRLFRGADSSKDQSYYLFGLTQEQLSRCWFPLGELTKDKVREHANRLALFTHAKPDSQEICFVPNNDYRTLLKAYAPDALQEGEIVTTEGETIGTHGGTPLFTIGQRKGIGIGGGKPYYVTELRPESNTVVVGDKEDLAQSEFIVERVNWVGLDPTELQALEPAEFRARVQIRYRHKAAPCSARLLADGSLYVTLDQPEAAITPGQAAAFYDEASDSECLAGGWIKMM